MGKWSMFILSHLPLEIPWENMDIVGNLVSWDILVEIIHKWSDISWNMTHQRYDTWMCLKMGVSTTSDFKQF